MHIMGFVEYGEVDVLDELNFHLTHPTSHGISHANSLVAG
jgi:hypothetical protein